MQLAPAPAGVDVDGDGSVDLDAQRLYYAGQSFGGIYGTIFLGVERALKAGVPNVPGGSIIEIVRLSESFRLLGAIALATRQPPLINLPPLPGPPPPFNLVFNENIPLRDLPPLVNTVPGALAIAELFDRNEWVAQAGNPVAYAPFVRKQPLQGNAPKPVIVQFGKSTDGAIRRRAAILRARGDRGWRDLLRTIPRRGQSRRPEPHAFLTNIATGGGAYAIAAQRQIANFSPRRRVTIAPDVGGHSSRRVCRPLPIRSTTHLTARVVGARRPERLALELNHVASDALLTSTVLA